MVDIEVYGEIGEDYFSPSNMTAAKFSKALKDAGGDDVTVHVNSPGGSVFDANAMAEQIRAYSGNVTAKIEGLAASAASYFALTANKVVMGKSALMMIHNPSTYCIGGAEDMRKTADFLEKVRDTITVQYADKSGISRGEIEELMDAETWFTADDALERGFVDEVADGAPVTACITNDWLKSFKNAPADLKQAAAGDAGKTIHPSNSKQPDTGAVSAGAGAAPKRTVCVNGQFINY